MNIFDLSKSARQEKSRRGGDPLAKQEIIEAALCDLAEWYRYRFPDLVADYHMHHVKERLQAIGTTQQ